ncbi:lytic transglycosylase domain-containing protein [Fundidesulfovibrio soli]|uniref:lytic transglycosylase domain-containing protein n=1 Tax=Fundidesulfovibrio soli TaxID=2922716 RepID=UPI001FAF39CC|nr:lytic transglycosylase domain-containing protein [Fundidesulfovibrio soli]
MPHRKNMSRKKANGARVAAIMAAALALLCVGTPARAQTIYHYQDPSGTVHLTDIQTTSEYRPYFYFRIPKGADRAQIAAIIVKEAGRYGLDPSLVMAMVEVESGFQVRAVSPKGAQGLMQIMPGTAQDLKLKDSFDAAKNIEAGSRYMRQLLDRFGGNVLLALAAYNAGPGAVSRCGGVPPIAETKSYIEKVKARYGKAI